jgi:hypothetical protein
LCGCRRTARRCARPIGLFSAGLGEGEFFGVSLTADATAAGQASKKIEIAYVGKAATASPRPGAIGLGGRVRSAAEIGGVAATPKRSGSERRTQAAITPSIGAQDRPRLSATALLVIWPR